MSKHPWSDELQAFLEAHSNSTPDDIQRDMGSLPESVVFELYRYLTVREVIEDAVRDGYLERIK